jgi:hypothetical protein
MQSSMRNAHTEREKNMIQSFELELTAADIVTLTDLIYEDAPQFWKDGEWFCPQTLEQETLLIQRCCDSANNDEHSAHRLSPGDSLAEKQCAKKNYQRHAEFVDRRNARSGTRL